MRSGTRARGRRASWVGASLWVVVAVLILSGPATGRLQPERRTPRVAVGDSVSIQAIFDDSGDPVVGANFVPDGSLAKATWEICEPERACRSAVSSGWTVQPGAEPAGTRFVAEARYRGKSYSSAVTWHGRVRAVTPPRLLGDRKVGSVMTPIAAEWTGGWGNESDQLGVEACRFATGRDCKMLGGGELGCPDKSWRPRLGGWFAGWYLFALDARMARDEACAGTGYFANADLPVWKPGPTIARSNTIGIVTGPRRPTVKILPKVVLHGNRLAVASVDCLARCRVLANVFGATYGSTSSETLTGHATVEVPRRSITPGALRVTLHVDDSGAITGESNLP